MGLRWAHLVAGYDQRPWKQHGKIPKEAEFHGPCSAGWTNILHRPRFWHIFMLAMGMVQHTATKMGSFNKDYPKICRSRFWFFRWLVNDAEGAFGATCAGGCQSRGELLFFFPRGSRVFVNKTCPCWIMLKLLSQNWGDTDGQLKLWQFWWFPCLRQSGNSRHWNVPIYNEDLFLRLAIPIEPYSNCWFLDDVATTKSQLIFFFLNHKLSAISSY